MFGTIERSPGASVDNMIQQETLRYQRVDITGPVAARKRIAVVPMKNCALLCRSISGVIGYQIGYSGLDPSPSSADKTAPAPIHGVQQRHSAGGQPW